MKQKKVTSELVTLFALMLVLIFCSPSTNETRKDIVHKIDNLLFQRMLIVVKSIKEDELLRNQDKYNRDYFDEIERSKLFIEYFTKRRELMSIAKKEIEEGYKELDLMLSSYSKNDSGYNLIDSFRKYFFAYKQFFDESERDLDKKIKVGILHKTIASLETNQQNLFDALDLNKIEQAKILLDNEAQLINEYRQNISLMDFEINTLDEWKKEFIDIYVRMHEWNKKFYGAKKQNNDALYNQLRIEGLSLFQDIPFVKTAKFNSELQEILLEIPNKFSELEDKSREAGAIAYEMYYKEKKKIGEDPYEFQKKLDEIR